jgi:hypothetical protein
MYSNTNFILRMNKSNIHTLGNGHAQKCNKNFILRNRRIAIEIQYTLRTRRNEICAEM